MKPTLSYPSLGADTYSDGHCDHYMPDNKSRVWLYDLNPTGGRKIGLLLVVLLFIGMSALAQTVEVRGGAVQVLNSTEGNVTMYFYNCSIDFRPQKVGMISMPYQPEIFSGGYTTTNPMALAGKRPMVRTDMGVTLQSIKQLSKSSKLKRQLRASKLDERYPASQR